MSLSELAPFLPTTQPLPLDVIKFLESSKRKLTEERFQRIFSQSLLPIVIYYAHWTRPDKKDLNFYFAEINEAARSLEPKDLSQALFKPVTEVFPGIDQNGFNLFQVFKHVFETQCPEMQPLSIYQDEQLLVCRRNWVFPVGESEIAAVYVDATKEHEQLSALMKSEKQFHALFDCSPNGIFITDESGRYILVNPAACQITRYSEAELLARTFEDLCVPELEEDLTGKDPSSFQNF
jgi:PAS domain-containing protein